MPERTSAPESVLFEEDQPTSRGVMGFVLALAALSIGAGAWGSSRQGKLGDAAPGLIVGALVAAAVTWIIGLTHLVTRVTTGEAVVRYGPFKTLRLRAGEIAAVVPRDVGLFSGGIGYHVGFRSLALTARTGSGVLVTKPDGYRILVGTEHPDALLSALLQLQRSTAPADRPLA